MNRTYVLASLALATFLGCSSPEPAPPSEPEVDLLVLLHEVAGNLEGRYASALRKGYVKESERLEVGVLEFQPQRGVRWKRLPKPLEEHLADELRAAGLPVAEAGQPAELTVNGLISLGVRRGDGVVRVDEEASLQVFRGRTVRCTGMASLAVDHVP